MLYLVYFEISTWDQYANVWTNFSFVPLKKNDNINTEFMFASDQKLPRGCNSGVRGLLTPFFSPPNVIFIF